MGYILFAKILTFHKKVNLPKIKVFSLQKASWQDAVLRHACGCKATSRKYELSALRMIVSIKQKTLR